MKLSNFAWLLGASLLAVVGCSNGTGDEPSADDNAGALTHTDAPAHGLEIPFVTNQDSRPATNVQADDTMRTCDTDFQYVQVGGTGNDAKINAVLKEGNDVPACEDAISQSSVASIRFVNANFLSVVESTDAYAAHSAHPANGQNFKNLDMKTGEKVTLDKVLDAGAKETILRSLRAQIGAMKELDETAPAGRKVYKKIDSGARDSLLSSAGFAVGDSLDHLTDWYFTNAGLRIDLMNQMPRALMSYESAFTVKWKTLADHVQPAYKSRLGL